jgi:hypothetical protein
MAWISLGLQGHGRAGVKLDAAKRTDQPRRHFVQLARVVTGELLKDVPALARQAEDGATLIAVVDRSLDEVFAFGAIDQLNGAVVLETEMACSIGDGDGRAFGSTGNLKQKLMLLRLQAGGDGCIFTELKEFSEFESEFCQGDEQVMRMIEIGLHVYISYHDIYDAWNACGESAGGPRKLLLLY